MASFGRQLASASSSALRSCQRQKCVGLRSLPSWRKVHTLRELPYPIEGGVGEFLPKPALETVVEWQEGLLQRLNDQTKGTPHANKPVLQMIIDTAGVEEKIMIYDYACLAANNSFFLDNLKPPTGTKPFTMSDLPVEIRGRIKAQYSDVSYLTDELVSSATGMMSSGWLWLVTDGEGSLAVLPTFGSGTLLIRSRERLKYLDIPVLAHEEIPTGRYGTPPTSRVSPAPSAHPTSSPVSGTTAASSPINPHTQSRAYSGNGRELLSSLYGEKTDSVLETRREQYKRGSNVYPLACVSLHEHAWMSAGLGVWGKEAYVSRWLSALNWDKVEQTYNKFQSRARTL